MLSIVEKEREKKANLVNVDFWFKSKELFDNFLPNLTTKISGPYKVVVYVDDEDDLRDMIKREEQFQAINLYIVASRNLLHVVSTRLNRVKILEDKLTLETFKKLLIFYSIHLADGCLKILWREIGADPILANQALESLSLAYPNTLITKEIISREFNMDNTIYPRQVLLAFLSNSRWRWNNLRKCESYFGVDMTYYSMRKGIRYLQKALETYYETGDAPEYIRGLSYQNVLIMRKCLEYQNNNVHDVYLILYLYEKGGLSINDYLN